MLAWMASFGELKRIGIKCTGTYGSGLFRYCQNAGLAVPEVTAPERMNDANEAKSDTIDAECAAHAAFSGIRTVTPKTRDGIIGVKNLPKNSDISPQSRSPDYPFQYYLCSG